jgi:hypothetical protein
MRTATHAGEEGLERDPNSPKPEEILTQLRHILLSPVFHGSKRCQQFLEYVCEKSLAGDAGALKERAVAIEVFGRRPETAGLGEDTIVRVGAREVRKRLAQYYMTGEGSAAPVLIDLPSGSYVPEFRYSAAGRHLDQAPPQPVAEVEIRLARRPNRLFAVVGIPVVVVLAVVFAVAKWPVSDVRVQAFQRFWNPVFRSPTRLLIAVGHPIVYQPSRRAAFLNAQRLPATPFPIQRKIELPAKELDGSDMVPVINQFIGFGDMVAANEVSQMMARRNLNVEVLLASSIPFADLRHSQAYLIGSLTNRWTMELGQNWRFQFGWNAEHVAVIKDTTASEERAQVMAAGPNRSPRVWSANSKDDGSATEDYSLICRIRNSPTGGLLIVSAGIKQFGTEAAGRLLTDPIELGAILNQLPPGWEERNLQIVLHMKVLGNTPAQPEVVASQVW